MSDISLSFDGHNIRVFPDLDGGPWWVGKDVCQALGIANHKDSLARIPDEGKDGVGITDPIGRAQVITVINEPGLYRLIFQSRVPGAERFKTWVFREVLPALRRDGAYRMPGTEEIHIGQRRFPKGGGDWLSLVRETRRLFGSAAARQVWADSPLAALVSPSDPLSGSERFVSEFIGETCVLTGAASDSLPVSGLHERAQHFRTSGGLSYPGKRSFGNALCRRLEAGAFPGVWRVKSSVIQVRGLRWR